MIRVAGYQVPWQRAVGAAAYLAVFIALFWPTFIWMAERFDAYDSFYSHGWLVPLASAWLLWQRREQVRAVERHPTYAGLWIVVPSLLVHLAASWLRIGFVSGFAMVALLVGLVWTLWGRHMVWAMRFPLFFLLFMVPLPGILLIAASFNMKMFAATLATAVLKLMQIPVQQAGSMIHAPTVSVVVDDTCSGLRSLISLIALSVLWISLLPKRARRIHKVGIVLASIPISIFANMVRIVVLVLLAYVYGPKAAEGFTHDASGFVVFGVAVAALAWVTSWLVPEERTS